MLQFTRFINVIVVITLSIFKELIVIDSSFWQNKIKYIYVIP